jgi:hypothetical protein
MPVYTPGGTGGTGDPSLARGRSRVTARCYDVTCIPFRARSSHKETDMSRVSLNQPAPDFTLPDFSGATVSLSDFLGRKNVLLVFNRTFT